MKHGQSSDFFEVEPPAVGMTLSSQGHLVMSGDILVSQLGEDAGKGQGWC